MYLYREETCSVCCGQDFNLTSSLVGENKSNLNWNSTTDRPDILRIYLCHKFGVYCSGLLEKTYAVHGR